MIIGHTPNGITTLTPDDGMGVTNGEVIADSIVFLGKFDSPDNWNDCDLPSEPTDTDATEQDYGTALRELGANV